jgi:hypothetical protein
MGFSGEEGHRPDNSAYGIDAAKIGNKKIAKGKGLTTA